MADALDDFVEELQEEMLQEVKETYGEEVFQRWLNPVCQGSMVDPDGYASLTGACSDSMQIFLKFKNGIVSEATFQTDGCGASSVCGSFAAEMAMGKAPDELFAISGDVILKRLGGLPKEEQHCAFHAAETLHGALLDYMGKQIHKKKE